MSEGHAAAFGEACAAIARAAAESLGLDEVVARIAQAVQLVVPFDAMGLWHAESPDDPVTLTLGPSDPRSSAPTERPLRRPGSSPPATSAIAIASVREYLGTD